MRQGKNLAPKWLVLAVLLLLVLAVAPVQALRDKKALMPTADSYVWNEGPDHNWGDSWELWVERSTISEILTFLRFDLAELPAGAVIEEAKLKLYGQVDTHEVATSVYYCANNDWTEEGITYNNMPAFAETPMDTVNVTSKLTWYEWNVTSIAQSAFSAEDKRLSLVLKADPNGHIAFCSSESPAREPNDRRPQLVVLYNAPSSSNNTALTSLIIITVTVAATAAVGLTYIVLKRRKTNPEKHFNPTHFKNQRLFNKLSHSSRKTQLRLFLKSKS